MEDILFYCSNNKESRLAKELLEKNQMDFITIFREDIQRAPSLQEGYVTYNGINRIKEHIKSSISCSYLQPN